LREFFPTFLATFTKRFAMGIASPEARAVLAIAPTPALASRLTVNRIAAALRRAGRSRGIDQATAAIRTALREPQMRHPTQVETAMGKQTSVLLATLDTACASSDDLGQACAELFARHPDHAIITSFPGLGDSTGARILAEIGDDRSRFGDARALKAYAGSAPITRASGKSVSITRRRTKNDRLAAAGWIWAFGAATHCRPAGEHYRRRREHGDRHAAAQRNLSNRLLGQLYHCLQAGQTFDESQAFSPPRGTAA
jgi:transposase